MTLPVIHRVTQLDLSVQPWSWRFAEERRADLDDVSAGALDMSGSIAREVEEETGLTPADYRAGAHWDCVVTGAAIAMIRILDVDSSGEALQARIEANLARQQQPELSAIHLVRDVGDLTAAMPRFVTAFIEAQSASP